MKHPLLSSSHNDIITQTLDDKYFVFFRIQTRIVWSKKSCVVISRSLLVIRLFSTKTGTFDNNTKFNQLSIKWNMLFSSDILDQFVKKRFVFTEKGRNLFVSDLFSLETSFRSRGNHYWFGHNQ